MVGSKVVIKEMAASNKLSLKYKPETFSVTERKGSELVVTSDEDGRQYRRNVSHTKLLPDMNASENENRIMAPEMGEPVEDVNPVPFARPKRNIVKPARFH